MSAEFAAIDFNIYAAVILAALVLDYVLNLVGDRLNLQALRADLPEEFRDVYEAERYRKSQEYLRANTRFELITATFGLVVLLVFWFAGGFVYLDGLLNVWFPAWWSGSAVLMGISYLGALVVLRFLLNLPFRLYHTFVIEARFGFNRTTPGTFCLDIVKMTVLMILLGAPLFAAILAFFQYAGDWAWLYCWGVATAFTLVLQFVAPRWIMPLFNKFTELEEGELKSAVENYAESVDFPLAGVYVVDGSRRSTKGNAFFTGFGRHKRIALFDTLVEKHTVGELVTVLAHEIGHFKKKHILKGMVLSIAHTGVLFFLLSLFIRTEGLYEAFGYSGATPIYAGFVFFGLLYSPVELVLSVLINAFLRRNEREADRFAVSTTGRPGEFAAALKKLSRDNLSNLSPHPFYVLLHYSHPPVLERVRKIERASGTVKDGGKAAATPA